MCCHEARLRTGVHRLTRVKMLSIFKTSVALSEKFPLAEYCELGRQTGSAGPELVWKIYEARRRTDNKVSDALKYCSFI